MIGLAVLAIVGMSGALISSLVATDELQTPAASSPPAVQPMQNDAHQAARHATESPLPDKPAPSPAPASAGTPHPAQTTTDLEQLYAQMDSQLRPNAAYPSWAAQWNPYAEVAQAEPSASVTSAACGDTLCRVTIRLHGDDIRGNLAEALSANLRSGQSMMFRYAEDRPGEMAMYVMAPDADKNDAIADINGGSQDTPHP